MLIKAPKCLPHDTYRISSVDDNTRTSFHAFLWKSYPFHGRSLFCTRRMLIYGWLCLTKNAFNFASNRWASPVLWPCPPAQWPTVMLANPRRHGPL